MATPNQDHHFMRMAIGLARRGRGRTSPNPMVGAVVVRRGKVIGADYHRKAGGKHAEVLALERAGKQAKGATLYVNLEPCVHYGRTAPCTAAIVEAGTARVVVGMIDPNPLVNGKGVRALRRAGIEVESGVMKEVCAELNAAFVTAMTRGRPLVTFKSAASLDGRVAARTGDARWISGEKARRRGHRMRSQHDAVLVGVGTVLTDDPRLDCRGIRGGRDPIRVVVDSRLRTPPGAALVRLAQSSRAPTWIVTTRSASRERARKLEEAGAQVLRVASRAGRVKISALLEALAERGVLSLLLEGGPTVSGSFLREKAIDRVACFVAPKLFGDDEAFSMISGAPALRRANQAMTLRGVRVGQIGDDVLIEGSLRWDAEQRR